MSKCRPSNRIQHLDLSRFLLTQPTTSYVCYVLYILESIFLTSAIFCDVQKLLCFVHNLETHSLLSRRRSRNIRELNTNVSQRRIGRRKSVKRNMGVIKRCTSDNDTRAQLHSKNSQTLLPFVNKG